MRLRLLTLFAVLFLGCLPALAGPGDLDAVEQYCGKPSGEHQGTSQVTNRMERDLYYGSVILHFQPVEDGWSFLSGWNKHLPMTEGMAEQQMPCFARAMEASKSSRAINEGRIEDPSIKAQRGSQATDTQDFGIPHLKLILILAVVVLICFFLPSARRRQPRATQVESYRRRRKPLLERAEVRGRSDRLDV